MMLETTSIFSFFLKFQNTTDNIWVAYIVSKYSIFMSLSLIVWVYALQVTHCSSFLLWGYKSQE